MKNYHPVRELFLTRMRSFYREPEAIFWTFVFPVLMTIGLGIAFRNRPAEIIDVAIEASPAAETIKGQLEAVEGFHVQIHEAGECSDRLRLGKVAIVVRPGDVFEYRYDPSRPESSLARAKLDDALQRAAGRVEALTVSDTETSEPGARYIDFLIPGLLGMNLMSGGLFGVGFVITDMRVKKLLRRLVATPMRRSHLMLSLVFGRMPFVVPEVAMIVGAGWLLFDMRIAGNPISILVLAIVGAMCFSGIGLLVASRAQRIESISGLTNLAMLPMTLLCGVFFSYDRFPDALQPVIQIFPLTHLIDALRAVVLEGATLGSQGVHVLVLVAWGVGTFGLAMKMFRWT